MIGILRTRGHCSTHTLPIQWCVINQERLIMTTPKWRGSSNQSRDRHKTGNDPKGAVGSSHSHEQAETLLSNKIHRIYRSAFATFCHQFAALFSWQVDHREQLAEKAVSRIEPVVATFSINSTELFLASRAITDANGCTSPCPGGGFGGRETPRRNVPRE